MIDNITSVSTLWLDKHAVVDLEHVDRAGEHQYVDAGAEPDKRFDGAFGLFHHRLQSGLLGSLVISISRVVQYRAQEGEKAGP